MLSRNNSLASNHPHRARSNASLGNHHHRLTERGQLENGISRQQALAAASRAFENAKLRDDQNAAASVDPSLDGRLAPENTRPSRLSRKSSIRFSNDIGERKREALRAKDEIARHDSVLSRKTQRSSITRAESFLDSSAAMNTHNTSLDDIASIPSSYRRVRKSRSMFNTRRSYPIRFRPNSSLWVRDDSSRTVGESSAYEPVSTLRSSKSTSFLRGGNDFLTFTSSGHNDAAIQAARDKYLHDINQQSRLRSRPSFIWTSIGRSSRKAFRKSVRTGCMTSCENAIKSSEHGNISPRKPSIGFKARLMSKSLTAKFRRIFQRPDSDDTLPPQQLEASRDYSDRILLEENPVGRPSQEQSDDDAALSCVQSRVPSLHIVSVDKPRSRSGSFHTIRSDGNSRVTSWTDSTAANTFATREAALERKKLSAISEAAGSDAVLRALPQGYAVFDTPIDTIRGHDRQFIPVSSSTLYSALRQKMRENEVPSENDIFAPELQQYQRPRQSSLQSAYSTVRRPAKFTEHFDQADVRTDDPSQMQSDFQRKLSQSVSGSDQLAMPKIQTTREAGSSSFPHYVASNSKGLSPYRLALAKQSDDRSLQAGDIHVVYNASDECVGTAPSVAQASSIYSRTTSGHTPERKVSPLSSCGNEAAGTAIIVVNRKSSRCSEDKVSSQRIPQSSPHPSGEWGKWMSSQVADLDIETAHLQIGEGIVPSLNIRQDNEIVPMASPLFEAPVTRTEDGPGTPLSETHGNTPTRKLRHNRSAATLKRKPSLKPMDLSWSGAGKSLSMKARESQINGGAADHVANPDAFNDNGVLFNELGLSINRVSHPIPSSSKSRNALLVSEGHHLRHNRSTATMKLRFARAIEGDKVNNENEPNWN